MLHMHNLASPTISCTCIYMYIHTSYPVARVQGNVCPFTTFFPLRTCTLLHHFPLYTLSISIKLMSSLEASSTFPTCPLYTHTHTTTPHQPSQAIYCKGEWQMLATNRAKCHQPRDKKTVLTACWIPMLLPPRQVDRSRVSKLHVHVHVAD